MKTILVTGGGTYIGQHLLERLSSESQHRIYGLLPVGHPYKPPIHDILPNGQSPLNNWHALEGDLQHPDLPRLLSELRPDIILHTDEANRSDTLELQLRTDVIGTQYLMQAMITAELHARLVIVSSASEYGLCSGEVHTNLLPRPVSHYGIAKLAQTHTALQMGLHLNIPVVVGRLFNVYGEAPKTTLIASIAAQLARLEQGHLAYPRVKVRNITEESDFLHVDDVADAIIALGYYGRAGEIYNIGSGIATPLAAIIEIYQGLCNLKSFDVMSDDTTPTPVSYAHVHPLREHTMWHPKVPLDFGLQRELVHWRQQLSLVGV